MWKVVTNKAVMASRIMDIAALTVSFLLFSLITNFNDTQHFLMNLILFVSITFICIRLSKRFIFSNNHSSNRTVKVLIGNIIGLVFSIIIISLLANFLAGFTEELVVIILASIFTFFILGTASPIAKSSDKDIIHH